MKEYGFWFKEQPELRETQESFMSQTEIMIVEDEWIVALETRSLLEAMGYDHITIKGSGPEAISHIQENGTPCLILMDINLEGELDGIETARRITRIEPVPVIFTTIYIDQTTLERAKQVKPAGYLIKPLDDKQLFISVNIALHNAEVEAALRKSEKRFRRMAEASPFPILIMDHRGAILYLNQKFTRLFGYRRADIPDHESWLEKGCPDPEYRCRLAEQFARDKRLAQTEEPPPREFEIHCPNGELKTVRFRLVWMDDDKYMMTCEDLTEQKRMEEELLRSRKLDALGTLAGGIAHDFNNLLAGILGNINLAQMNLSSDSPVFRWLGEAEKASFRARELIRRISDFAMKNAPKKTHLSVTELLQSTAELALSGSSARCRFDFAPDLWMASIDHERMGQVFSNIILNAAESMPQGGTIHIRAENLPVEGADSKNESGLAPGDYLRIAFTDQGRGIAQADMPRIFDPYFSTKKRGSQKGMGFGLPLVYRVVNDHEGHVEVRSRPGEGTTVVLYLPASRTALKKPESASPPPAPTASESKRILAMDDDEMIRDLLSQMLDCLHCRAVLAQSGEEAIALYEKALAEKQPFDGVILDLTVRGAMGGKEAMKAIQKMDPGVRALLSSGYPNDPVMADHGRWGFKGVIVKPYQMEDLKAALNQLFSASK